MTTFLVGRKLMKAFLQFPQCLQFQESTLLSTNIFSFNPTEHLKMETRSRARQKNGSHPAQGTNGHRTPAEGNPEDAGGVTLPKGAIIMFVSLLLDLLAFTMILPLLPSILEYYGNQPQVRVY